MQDKLFHFDNTDTNDTRLGVGLTLDAIHKSGGHCNNVFDAAIHFHTRTVESRVDVKVRTRNQLVPQRCGCLEISHTNCRFRMLTNSDL